MKMTDILFDWSDESRKLIDGSTARIIDGNEYERLAHFHFELGNRIPSQERCWQSREFEANRLFNISSNENKTFSYVT